MIVNKNVCKTFVGTKIHENMQKISIKYVDAVLREDLAPLTEHDMLTRSRERALAPLTEHDMLTQSRERALAPLTEHNR